ncbi:hypothetical protein O4J56_15315 [Nocardiopsis sp. RSe5-2]|uniref:Uncharacterized protein n=1 Tax=Nocardiopsis endophytica TaxID=3018445 RepID=A0ABT4U4X8_9ACTN|nr:hypothetical protein [Nocardiopsis endophytica]MDA2812011.1 hypothetical protein [Nocardiopsis endophytica]
MGEPFDEQEERRLRRALAVIGEEAGRPSPAGNADPAPSRTGPAARRARLRWAAVGGGALVAAAAAGLLAVAPEGAGGPRSEPAAGGSPGAGGAPGAGPEGGQGQTLPEWIACSTTIVEGEVTSVEEPVEPVDPATGGPYGPEPPTVTFTLEVSEWIKPATGEDTVELTVSDPAFVDPREAIEPGAHVLVSIPRTGWGIPDVFEGERLTDTKAEIEAALPEARGTECPEEWGGTDHPAT